MPRSGVSHSTYIDYPSTIDGFIPRIITTQKAYEIILRLGPVEQQSLRANCND